MLSKSKPSSKLRLKRQSECEKRLTRRPRRRKERHWLP